MKERKKIQEQYSKNYKPKKTINNMKEIQKQMEMGKR
jgi:hypothetical protein